MSGLLPRRFGVALLAFVLVSACATSAFAAISTSYLTGTVTSDGKPVPDATVTASGNNQVVRATTDARGRFTFSSLSTGTYSLVASANGLRGEARVDISSGGATVVVVLVGLKEIGRVAVARSAPVRGSGTDVALNNTVLTRSPSSDSFPETLIQLPGAVRGANGVVHLTATTASSTISSTAFPYRKRSIAKSAVKSIPTTSHSSMPSRARTPRSTAYALAPSSTSRHAPAPEPPGSTGTRGSGRTRTSIKRSVITPPSPAAEACPSRFATSSRPVGSIRRTLARRTTTSAIPINLRE